MILICSDGSPDAKATIEHGAELLKGQPVTVLTVRQPFVEVLAHTPSGFGLTPGMVDLEEIDKSTRKTQRSPPRRERSSRQAGLDAQPRVCSQVTTTSSAILAEADEVGALAILIGSRGLTGLKSLLLGSVSHAVTQHADRTVIVVPSPAVAAARERDHRNAQMPA